MALTNNITPHPPVTVTPAAARKCFEFIQEANDNHLKFRVSIQGGGCKGFKYDIKFADTVDFDDVVITYAVPETTSTIDWVVDQTSLQFLKGIEIDYQSLAGGENFVIRNVKVKSTCGCGHSFDIPESTE